MEQSKSKIIDNLDDVEKRENITLEDLDIQYHTGRAIVSGTGRDRKVSYRTGYACTIGDVKTPFGLSSQKRPSSESSALTFSKERRLSSGGPDSRPSDAQTPLSIRRRLKFVPPSFGSRRNGSTSSSS